MSFSIQTLTKKLKAASSLGVLAFGLAACANMPVVPLEQIPDVPAPTVVDTLTPAHQFLDCTAASLVATSAHDPIKIMLGPLRNQVGPSVGSMSLPLSLQSAVRTSFARFDNGIELYNSGDLTGFNALSGPNGAPLLPFLPAITWPSQVADVDLVIDGELYVAQVARSTNAQAEIEFLGGGARAEVYDVRVQLYLFSPESQRFTLRPVTLGVRAIIAENGLSGYYIRDDTYGRYKLSVTDHSTALTAIQYVTDTAVGILMSELAAEVYGTPKAHCERYLQFTDLGRPVGNQIEAIAAPPELEIFFEPETGRLCTTVTAQTAQGLPNGTMMMRWRQFRRSGIEIDPIHVRQVSGQQLRGPQDMKVCLSQASVSRTTHRTEVTLERPTGEIVAAGRYTDNQGDFQ